MGYVNVGIGMQGMVNVELVCQYLVEQVFVLVNYVFFFFIGVIGELLLVDCVVVGIFDGINRLLEFGWVDVAVGIMIIDIWVKGVFVQVNLQGKVVIIIGILKGVGMIKLNMVIMLGYVVIDVVIVLDLL